MESSWYKVHKLMSLHPYGGLNIPRASHIIRPNLTSESIRFETRIDFFTSLENVMSTKEPLRCNSFTKFSLGHLKMANLPPLGI